MDRCSKRFRKHKVLIIVGDRGVGKSRTGIHLLQLFRNQYTDFTALKLTDLYDVKETVSVSKKFVLLLDGVFENVKCFEYYAKEREALDIVYALADSGTCKIILTVQLSQRKKLQHLFQSHRLFQNVFEVTLRLSDEEKRQIFLKYCEANSIIANCAVNEENYQNTNGLQENDDIKFCSNSVDRIVQSDPAVGFPQSCFMFTTNEKCTCIGPAFFYHPSESLVLEISNLRGINSKGEDRKLAYIIIVYLMLTQITLTKRNFDLKTFSEIAGKCFPDQFRSFSWYKIAETANEFDKKYIVLTNSNCSEEYQIKSRMINEAVILSYYQVDPDSVISVIEFDFIEEVLRLEGYHSSTFEAVMIVTKENYPTLVQRLTTVLHQHLIPGEPLKCIDRLCKAKFWNHVDDVFLRLLTEHVSNHYTNNVIEIEYRNTQETVLFYLPIYLILCLSKEKGFDKSLQSIFDFMKTDTYLQNNSELRRAFSVTLLSSFEYIIKYGKTDFKGNLDGKLELIFEEIKDLDLLNDASYYIKIALEHSNDLMIFWLLKNLSEKLDAVEFIMEISDKHLKQLLDLMSMESRSSNPNSDGRTVVLKSIITTFCNNRFNVNIARSALRRKMTPFAEWYLKTYGRSLSNKCTIDVITEAFKNGLERPILVLLEMNILAQTNYSFIIQEACRHTSIQVVNWFTQHNIDILPDLKVVLAHLEGVEYFFVLKRLLLNINDIDIVAEVTQIPTVQCQFSKFISWLIKTAYDFKKSTNKHDGKTNNSLKLLHRLIRFSDINQKLSFIKTEIFRVDHPLFDMEREFQKAAQKGNFEIVELLLDKVNHALFDMNTAMNAACERDSIDIVNLLLDNFDHTLFDMKTAMTTACDRDSMDIVMLLLDKVDHTLFDMKTAMNAACERDSMDIVMLLLDKVDHTLFDMKMTMNEACCRGTMYIVKLLLDNFDHTLFDMKTVMNEACERDSMDIVKLLLHKVDHTLFDMKTVMNGACERDSMDIVELLLHKVHHTLFDMKTVMNAACERDSMDIVMLLLDMVDHTLFDMKTAMNAACERDSMDIVMLLLDIVDNTLFDMKTAMNAACEYDRMDIVKLLLDKVDHTLFDMKTVMNEACEYGMTDIVKLLLDKVDHTLFDMKTVMNEACKYGMTDIVKLLLDKVDHTCLI